MKVIGFYSIKGGVGKTASAVNVSYLAAQEGLSTLLCDLDPQGSSSYYFRVRPAKKHGNKTLIRGAEKIDKFIRGTDYAHLDVLPADMSYRKLDILLDDVKKSKRVLKSSFKPFGKQYDLLVFDCPPNITLLSENIFQAVDYLMVPVKPSTLSLLTFEKLMEFFDRKSLKTKMIKPFYSMVEKRKNLHRELLTHEAICGVKLLKHSIPYSTLIEQMGIHREPVVKMKPKSKAAEAYDGLWGEMKKMIV